MAKLFVSKKILFLYFSPRQKSELEKCEKVLKVLFRKFRKSAVFSYMQADISQSCRQLFREKLYEEMHKNDAIFISGDISEEEKNVVLRDILGEYAEAHFLKGCVICHPPSYFTSDKNDENIVCTHTIKRKEIEQAIDTATKLALQRKRKLTVCVEDGAGTLIENAVFDSFDKSLHLERKILPFDEAIYICMKSIPTLDVVLSTEQVATILKMHISHTGTTNFPGGYSVIYTEKGKVYTRQVHPFEALDNSVLFSVLLAFSAVLEKELNMKNAADWLRRASSVSFDTHRSTDADDFIQKVISEIEKPMRIRK